MSIKINNIIDRLILKKFVVTKSSVLFMVVMKFKILFLFFLYFFLVNYTGINFKFYPFAQRRIKSLDEKKQMVIDEDIFIYGNISIAGVITSLNGLKITNGTSKISGTIYLNSFSANETNIGNSNNGGDIHILTSQNNDCTLQSRNIILRSQNITIPDNNNTLPLTVDSQGVVRTLYSTRKMKENIVPLSFCTEDIKKMHVYKFNYIKESGLPQGEEWGFIAEELLGTSLHECVIKNNAGEVININEKKLFAFSISIIKELLKKIDGLEKRIQNFELSYLEKKI